MLCEQEFTAKVSSYGEEETIFCLLGQHQSYQNNTSLHGEAIGKGNFDCFNFEMLIQPKNSACYEPLNKMQK